MAASVVVPECWGHRGASAHLPENTMASFKAAIAAGVDGLESDVHVSRDGVLLMFHDPTLNRTTNFTGEINQRDWFGPDGMEHARTKKEPRQPIPTFNETLALVMQPENMHIKLNADIKPSNDPEKLFSAMHTSISAFPDWETKLAPRILLGLWHPKFIRAAKRILPYCRRSCISFSLWLARTYLWEDVECVSIAFNVLLSPDGQKLYQEAHQAGKRILVFTVNRQEHMMEMVRLQVDVILTDYPERYLELRSGLQKNYQSMLLKFSDPWFLWKSLLFYSPIVFLQQRITLPSSIQRRFLSFVLRKSLGHLLKPGQLDVDQIDSQIGSGYVQVSDLQLNDNAINDSLAGLPLELAAGSISRVTARIPWPNPLTSTVGLSIEGLHLTFRVVAPRDAPPIAQNLTESVVSVADSFIHDELTAKEEATLRESFHPDLVADVPGGLDPFISAPEEEPPLNPDDDPAGVSIFATLIERLLARFEFDATNTTVSIEHAERVCFTAHLPRIEYGTDTAPDEGSGVTRSITIAGLSVTARSLSQYTSEPESVVDGSVPQTRSPSPTSSSSSLDEATQFAMSQSLAFLPRPASPASSVASSMYQSAISEADATTPDEEPERTPPRRTYATEPQVLLSFSGDPLKIGLTTPGPREAGSPGIGRSEVMTLSVEMGFIGCALAAWHLREVMGIVDAVASSLPQARKPSQTSASSTAGYVMEMHLALRGVILLLLPALAEDPESATLAGFFGRPHIPPKLLQPYLRLHLDTIQATMSPSSNSSTFFLADISAFAFHGAGSTSASPILITDHNLPSQYAITHIHHDSTTASEQPPLPTFAVLDWTDPEQQATGMKISHWRVKPPSQRAKGQPSVERPPSHAVDVVVKRSTRKTEVVDIAVEPLHLFLNLDSASTLQQFVNELTEPPSRSRAFRPLASRDSDEDTPPTTPQPRQRSENTALDVLADMDEREVPSTSIDLKCAMVRIETRCPPPPGSTTRSGAFVVDIHGIHVSVNPGETPKVVRFSPTNAREDPLGSVRSSRILVAYSPAAGAKATAILSAGPLQSVNEESALLPCISVANGSVSVKMPSVYAYLSKNQLDGLQYFIDDCSQLFERISASNVATLELDVTGSGDTELIGSRFFSKSRTGSGSGSTLGASNSSQGFLATVEVTEASLRIILGDESSRPFDIIASDVEIVAQTKKERKEETVFTVTARGLEARNTNTARAVDVLLSLTTPRGLISSPRPILKLVFTSFVVPETTAKESKLRMTLWGFTFNFSPYIQWIADLQSFVKPPPGAFESVVPTERTHISLKILDGSIRAVTAKHPGALVIHSGNLTFSTTLVGGSTDVALQLSLAELAVMMVDDLADVVVPSAHKYSGVALWNKRGYALLSEISHLDLKFSNKLTATPPLTSVLVERLGLRLHLCADSLSSVTAFGQDLAAAFSPPSDEDFVPKAKAPPAVVSSPPSSEALMASVDDMAFNRVPEVGPPADMINDDLPTNLDYLDESFGAAAGLRELRDDDLDDFDVGDATIDAVNTPGLVSKVGGETIKMFRPEGLHIVEHHFDTLPPETTDVASTLGVTTTRVRVHNADINVFLYDGYDWVRTRRTIEDEVKQMRRRLAKIRQLVAGGQTQDPSFEETGALLFNSVYIGLDQDADELEPAALIAAIDEELKDDLETASQSSWQSLRPSAAGAQPRSRSMKVHGKRLTRAKAPSIEFQLMGLEAEVDQYHPDESIVSRTFATVKDLEILDRMGTSTWNKFLSELRSDLRGNVRETDSSMVRVELRSVRPVPGLPSEEARLRAKILPLRLYVDQDALDFLKTFFSFKDPYAAPPTGDSSGDIYFQLAEIFPVDLKLDYKPRRVDYRALREGRTIELMNFFHFDGAEMTLRHITLSGITGWPRLFDLLNDIWTPDVKATQLVDVISGVAPIRSVVNVGSGVADLVLLPIAQYKKDGRIVRGVQKGTTAFLKSTAVEAIKLGARLATGTQVILEQAEDVLGGQFKGPVTTEAVQPVNADYVFEGGSDDEDEPDADRISKYAEQPADLREGVQSAYKSLQRNLHSAAQTILAVPMEVYERSGTEGPVRAVVRAVPIAVLKSGIGVTEAVSKTMLGLHNTLQPETRQENDAKYKHRS
uniref:Autophagy-related protein 2 n=1 Tax=Mycena chlorophos TaxID=658473 RepID=A0ABQ0LQ59_MYCCL|nr:predicted protein [Mycena chlorophos]